MPLTPEERPKAEAKKAEPLATGQHIVAAILVLLLVATVCWFMVRMTLAPSNGGTPSTPDPVQAAPRLREGTP